MMPHAIINNCGYSITTLGCEVSKWGNSSLTNLAFDLEDALKGREAEWIEEQIPDWVKNQKTEKLIGRPKASSVVENKDVINRIL